MTLDGQGAWLIGDTEGAANEFAGIAILAEGVTNVTIKNVNAKGWENAKAAYKRDGNLSAVLARVDISEEDQAQLIRECTPVKEQANG